MTKHLDSSGSKLYRQVVTIHDNPYKNPDYRVFTPDFSKITEAREGIPLVRSKNTLFFTGFTCGFLSSIEVSYRPKTQTLVVYPQTATLPESGLVAFRLGDSPRFNFVNVKELPRINSVELSLRGEYRGPELFMVNLPEMSSPVTSYDALIVTRVPFPYNQP